MNVLRRVLFRYRNAWIVVVFERLAKRWVSGKPVFYHSFSASCVNFSCAVLEKLIGCRMSP